MHPLQKSDLHWWNKILEEKSLANIEHFSPMLAMGFTYSIEGSLSLYGHQGSINRKLGIQGPFDLLVPNVYERPKNADKSCFFFASYSKDGSRLYMKDDSDKVYYCARRDATPLKEWNSFSEMLIEEIQRLKSLHGADGMLQVPREETLPIT